MFIKLKVTGFYHRSIEHMQNILIVEDNQLQLNMLVNTITNEYPSWTIKCADNYNDALILINKSLSREAEPFTLFLLDIQLTDYPTDRGGFLLAEEIRKLPAYYRTNILFLTGISDQGGYALSNFHCYNYITKPYTEKDILNQIEQMLITGYLEKSFMITDTDKIIHRVKCCDILYVKALRHMKTIYLNGSHICTRAYNLEDLISMADGELIMCHKGYLINPRHISSYDRLTSSVIIKGDSIPVGRKYAEQIHANINNLNT